MGLFSSIFSAKPKATAAPPPAEGPVSFSVPAQLPKLSATSATPILKEAGLKPPERTNTTDTLSTAGCLDSLLKEKKAADSVTFLAHALPQKDAVHWAAVSCDAVKDKLSPADQLAAAACREWLANPTSANQALAANAAQQAEHGGPGAWAAQAAAWCKGGSAVSPTSGPAAALSPPVGKAVAGCVMLAAALNKPGVSLPQKPSVIADSLPVGESAAKSLVEDPAPSVPAEEYCRLYKPFIDKGIQIAAST